MMCAWKELLGILPVGIRGRVDTAGKETMQELRLRLDAPPELVLDKQRIRLEHTVTKEDLSFVINTASRYSPWAAATMAQGYLTAPGGHRIGVCGETVVQAGTVTGFRQIRSLCIRVARDFPGIARDAPLSGRSVLIIGAPGWGKTTLLRDVVRKIGEKETVAVLDERGEVFPEGFPRGKEMDVLTGCAKAVGIPMLLRTMSPQCIAVDEITEEQDCTALIHAANCGVRLVATAHAADLREFSERKVYQPLVNAKIFEEFLVLRRDKSYRMERNVL